ncbi:hypothetical protein [Actinomadura madurae]|uniref:hypothetical protein n=1 Tax=Actinomadura madurae TaxID=1993 RepID=UPI000D892250|nr:hypothetical protein [Actinomadura madurae]SPT59328.1 Uncharacterised protein [Actinomadura madurae]
MRHSGSLGGTVATVLALLAAVAVAAITAYFVATEAPGGTRALDAYNAAPRCPAEPPAPAECRWTREFTVTGVHRTAKRGELDRAFLTAPDGVRWETSYPNSGPVLDDLGKGDRVTGTIWRGRLTEIAANGDTQDTSVAPADMRARFLIAALIVVPPALLVAAACAWRLARRRDPEPTRGFAAMLGLAVALFFAGLFTPLLASAGGENFPIMVAVWLPQAAVLTAVARIYVTRKHTLTTRTASP